jgi:opacity protein-like surface antigen
MRHGMKATVLALSLMAANAHGEEPPIRLVNDQACCDYVDRFYIAGILGSSFSTLTVPGVPSASDNVFAPGGALGYSFQTDQGAVRLEVEGRQRDPVAGPGTFEDGFSTTAISATGGWSTTVNLWRDFDVSDRVTCYIGGGIGAGGYQFGINEDFPIQDTSVTGLGTVSGFAWQAGGGVAWAITDGLTLDLGYRFFDLGAGGLNAQVSQTGVPIDTTRFTSAFSASELFFAFRIYEPFRGWW